MKKSYLNTHIDLNTDEVVEVLDDTPFWSAPFGIRLLENVRFKKNMAALDIGFGTGFPIIELAMRLGNSSKLYGIDPWDAAIKRAKKKIEQFGIKNIELIEGFAESLIFDNESLDLIVSNNGINNVDDWNAVLSECSRVLKDNGQFLISLNLNTSLIEFYNVLETVLKESGMLDEIEKIQQHIYEKRKPLAEIQDKIEENGFEIKKVIKDNFAYTFADGTAMFNHYFIQLAFLEGWKSIVPAARLESIFDKVEKKLNKVAEEKGEIRLSIPFVVIDCSRKNRNN